MGIGIDNFTVLRMEVIGLYPGSSPNTIETIGSDPTSKLMIGLRDCMVWYTRIYMIRKKRFKRKLPDEIVYRLQSYIPLLLVRYRGIGDLISRQVVSSHIHRYERSWQSRPD